MNFAQGDLAMLGAMAGVTLGGSWHLPYVLVALGAMSLAAMIFLAFQLTVLRELARRRATLTSMVMATLALSIFLQGAAQLVWGQLEQAVPSPLPAQPLHMAGVIIVPHDLFVIAVAALAFVLMQGFFQRSLLGKALLATGYEPEAARLVGIDPARMVGLTFLLGGAFAALAGLIVGPITFAAPWMGLSLAVNGFAASMIGGLGSTTGALVGGLLIGLLHNFGAAYISSAYADTLVFLALMLVLFARPSGLLGSPLITGEHF
jgi:branched-chain amino acid transport system permease protein